MKVILVALVMLTSAGCIGAYQVTAVSPGATGAVAPVTPDPDAGLVGIAPGADLRPYTLLLVDRFEVSPSQQKDAEDRELAARLAPLFQTELITRIRAAGLFDRVINLSETTFTAPDGVRTLRLEGAITRLNTGSRALRYFVGFGAGASKAQIEARLVDAATGQLLVVTADRREAAFGMFGGDGEEHLREALSDTARDFAKFLTRVKTAAPPQAMDARAMPAGAAASEAHATPRPAPVDVPGIWRDPEQGGVLRISGSAASLDWQLETRDKRMAFASTYAGAIYRASGEGKVTAAEVVLRGRITSGDGFSLNQPITITLTRDGKRLSGTAVGSRNVPFKVEFERAP